MTAKVILVTGATDGIGHQTAVELARLGHSVGVHGRSPAKVQKTVEQVKRVSGNPHVEGFIADLASLEQVRALAAEVRKRLPRLDVLLNNAGVYMHERVLTADRLETTFQVNHLATMSLTLELLPLLKDSAPSRVVTVSSIAHRRGALALDDLQLERGFDGYRAYANSKLANVLFTFELAARLEGTGVTANCLHPGVIGTKLLREGFGSDGASVEEGAATSVYLATSEDVAHVTGKYFVSSREAQVAEPARDASLQRALWEESERLLGIAQG